MYQNRKFAVRLNAFQNQIGFKGTSALERTLNVVGEIDGISHADLNFPDHFSENSIQEISKMLEDRNIGLNGLAMRYYTNPAFTIGAFTNPNKSIRREAIDLTKQGLDSLAELGGKLLTVWLGQDGFDYSFQCDYSKSWEDMIEAFVEISDHIKELNVSIEYKPNEPRAYAIIPDVSTTLLAIQDINRQNVGVTLDLAHVLYANEMPSYSAVLVNRFSKLMGVHLNDGYGKRDDGLMIGTVHPIQLVELFIHLERLDYRGVLYFDTFPDHSGLDPVEESRTNLELVFRLQEVAGNLVCNNDLKEAIRLQDATKSQRIIANALYGA